MANVTVKTKTDESALFEQLAVTAPRGALHAFWLGQAGFALKTHDTLLLIDPYLSDSLAQKYRGSLFTHARMMPPPIQADDLRGVDYLLATHEHSDHLDPGSVGTIMALNPACSLVCPKAARDRALQAGADPDRIIHARFGEKRSFGAFTLEALPSAHEELTGDGEGGYACAGYVLNLGCIRIYHSGDCVPYDGLAGLLQSHEIDVAFLPVNGRDEYRAAHGVPGNFTVEEAVDLCLNSEIGHLIPHHFGMFDFNTVAADEIAGRIAARAGGLLTWSVPKIGELLAISKPLASMRSTLMCAGINE